MQPEAVLVKASLEALHSPLRVAEHEGRGVLTFSFTAEYRAWVHIVYVNEHTRGPTVMARVVLRRAYVELGLGLPESEARAKAARRRPQAWMTIDGERHVGVGVDATDYRAVAVVVDGEMIVAVVPLSQTFVALQLAPGAEDEGQRRGYAK